MSVPLYLVFLSFVPSADHQLSNALYRELREQGVKISPRARTPLPAPTMLDGLDAGGQEKVLTQLTRDEFPLEEFVRKSVVAPQITRFRDIEPSDPKEPAYGVDVWFVAYGDLEVLVKQDVHTIFGGNRKEVVAHVLTDAELEARSRKRGVTKDCEERYVHVDYPMLDRVQIEMTTFSVATRTADSILIASRLDPSFTNDAAFPNRWRAIDRDGDEEAGKPVLGPPHPYECTAFYLKITRLHTPRGALFIEYHRVSTEPGDWFHGANLLRSKFPIVIQSEVRAFRRSSLKTLTSD
jgi:hypothetical protein